MISSIFFYIWIATIIWVIKDIINRTNNILLQILSISTVLFLTPLWVVIYLLIRPSKTLLEKYYEQGDFEPIEEENDEFETIDEIKEEEILSKCFNCGFVISSDFHFCPNCKVSLKKECSKCHRDLNADWKICPYCGNEEEISEEKKTKKRTSKKEELTVEDNNISE